MNYSAHAETTHTEVLCTGKLNRGFFANLCTRLMPSDLCSHSVLTKKRVSLFREKYNFLENRVYKTGLNIEDGWGYLCEANPVF